MPAANKIDTASLRNLRAGSVVTVSLRSGRELTGTLQATPTIACVGKPGIHRVRLLVADTAALRGLGDGATSTDARRHVHSVAGDKVLAIVSAESAPKRLGYFGQAV